MRLPPLACLALTAALAAPALADEGSAALRVTRGDGTDDCPDAAALSRALSDANTHRVLSTDPKPGASQRYEVTFARGPAGYEVTIRVSGPRAGVRVVRDPGPSCGGVAEATLLTLSLLLDEDAPAPEAPPPPPPELLGPPAPAAPVEEAAAPLLEARAAIAADAAAGVAAGLVRPVAPLLAAGASWSRGRISVGLAATWIPTQALPLGPGTVDVWFAGAQASACFYPLASRLLRIGGCPLAAAGVLQAAGQGYTRQSTEDVAWVAAGLGLTVSGGLLGPLGWRARAGGLVPVTAQGFSVDHVGTAYAPAPVAAVADLGLSVSIY